MVENIAIRLKDYDMYAHAKTYEAYSLEAILADDLEMPKPEEFFKNLHQDSDSEGNYQVPEEAFSFGEKTDSEDSLNLWKEEDEYLQKNKGDIFSKDDAKVAKIKTKTCLKKEEKLKN